MDGANPGPGLAIRIGEMDLDPHDAFAKAVERLPDYGLKVVGHLVTAIDMWIGVQQDLHGMSPVACASG